MNKIYQKMYPANKNCSKSVLGGFMDNVTLRSFYSASHPYSSVSGGLFSPFVIPEDCNRESQPYKTTKWPGCRVKIPRHDGNRKDIILKSSNFVNCLVNNPRGNRKNVIQRNRNSGSHPYFAKHAGFTLIELLVAVLLIGILAAVALPQYQVAVLKSRYTQAMLSATALRRAQDVYFMANGTYAIDMTKLDVQLSGCEIEGNGHFCTADNYMCYVYDGSQDAGGSPRGTAYCQLKPGSNLIYSASPYYKWPVCMAGVDSKIENQVCLSMGGEHFGNGSNGYHAYYLK